MVSTKIEWLTRRILALHIQICAIATMFSDCDSNHKLSVVILALLTLDNARLAIKFKRRPSLPSVIAACTSIVSCAFPMAQNLGGSDLVSFTSLGVMGIPAAERRET